MPDRPRLSAAQPDRPRLSAAPSPPAARAPGPKASLDPSSPSAPSLPASATAPAAAPPPSAATTEVVVPLQLELPEARAGLAEVPVLAALAPEFTLFSDADADAALRKGGRSRDGITLWTFLPSAFAWHPRSGHQYWVLSGRSGERVLLAVLLQQDGRLTHAASTLIDEPEATIAVGHSPQYPAQLTWTTCYGCPGEGGAIVLREDGRVAFSYR